MESMRYEVRWAMTVSPKDLKLCLHRFSARAISHCFSKPLPTAWKGLQVEIHIVTIHYTKWMILVAFLETSTTLIEYIFPNHPYHSALYLFLASIQKGKTGKNYLKVEKYQILTNNWWVSLTQNFPWNFPLSDWLERKFLNCGRNFYQNGNQGILPKGYWLAKEAQCYDDARQCNFPSFWLIKEAMTNGEVHKMMWWGSFLIGWGMIRSHNVNMMPNDAMQILSGHLSQIGWFIYH